MALLELQQEIFNALRTCGYTRLQYIPTRRSVFGVFKAWENLSNLLLQQKHLMLYYAMLPGLYLFAQTFGNPRRRFFFDFCFLNKVFDLKKIEDALGVAWAKDAADQGLLESKLGGFRLSFSIMPFDRFLIIRDKSQDYVTHQNDEQTPPNRVWVGADSVHFARLNRQHLQGQRYRRVLELGSGTGIQLFAIEHLAERLEGIDINPRAVELTNLNAMLNGLSGKVMASESDLYVGLEGTFDLILANPWFIDIQKAGLEEIPDIIAELDNYLAPGGTFVMYFSSFVQQGTDRGLAAMQDFSTKKGYDATFWHLGQSLDPAMLKQYALHEISHLNTWYCLLRKTDKGSITIHPRRIPRAVRDSVYLRLQRLIA